jgi:CRISPR/Cas system endoribonuclease Cas6 (RAMP superfamily)
MKLKVETLEDKQKSLIVYRKLGHLIELLKSKLAKKNVEVYLSPLLPKKIDVFDYCFLIDEKRAAEKAIEYPKKNIVAIFINQEKAAKKLVHRRLKNLKIINIAGNFFSEMDVDRILWFSFSQTKEQYLSIYALTKSKPFKNKFRPSLDLKKMVSKKVIVPLILVLLFLYHFAFLVPLSFSGYLLTKFIRL